jgi:hypothetical protein
MPSVYANSDQGTNFRYGGEQISQRYLLRRRLCILTARKSKRAEKRREKPKLFPPTTKHLSDLGSYPNHKSLLPQVLRYYRCCSDMGSIKLLYYVFYTGGKVVLLLPKFFPNSSIATLLFFKSQTMPHCTRKN